MRRVILTIAATITGLVLLLGFKTHPIAQAVPDPTSSAVSPPAASPSIPSPSAASPSATAPTAAAPAGGVQTFIGTAVNTRYGPVQVQVTVTGSKITGVTALQVPSESGRDQQINSYAVPQLTQEVLAAQSAQVDMVSGGTYTSEGYLASLQSALDQAGIH
ncbi:FMN-binding protein [Paenarthrobacter sp. Z7-10]|uniref:FMN-binding protein n=1 Tax=Paenarthrobacter sp. Z7-10 TaxID=2787635 RepID=UPI0022A91C75|nr:FMN-binding protein [Paenarthrobacter sp. Z7-10]MCZ2404216.1 FMN-binding protein [Paenarthrobacter sp. Z7-10]